MMKTYWKKLHEGIAEEPWYWQWICGIGLSSILLGFAEPFWPNPAWRDGYIGTIGVDGEVQAFFICIALGALLPLAYYLFSKLGRN